MRVGEMVKADGIGPLQVVAIDNGVAELLIIDGFGQIRFIYADLKALRPMRDVFNVRSCWPELRRIDEAELAEEERRARLEKRAKAKKARKSKASKKIKRRRGDSE
ncbi:MAG: hypothetical protein M9932_01815 [Xanthobacteraceae bacterium]|nr:hypothetical protein [Xanthobacteraceae bacterium]